MTTSLTQNSRQNLIDYLTLLAEKNKRQSSDDLLCFAHHILPYYTANWHHRVIADYLEKVEQGEIDRLMIFMPPRHGKSELASVLFPAWYLGRNPTSKVIASSYSSELAQDFGYQVRNHINDHAYQAVFDTRLKADSQAKNNWRTEQGGHYMAVGAGGAITGRGADLLIIDDPVKNREEADSAVYRDKIYRWYTSTAYTRLHSGGKIVVIQTRWHDDDLSGRLLKENPEEWTTLNFPAIATTTEQYRDVGDALWNEKYDIDALLRIKNNVGEDWSPLYQQQPIDTTNAEFKADWIMRWGEDAKRLPNDLKIRVIVDLASSEDKRSDENAILVIGQDMTRRRYVLESWGDWNDEGRRFNPEEMIEKIYSLADKYHHKDNRISVHVETVSYQRTMQYWLKQYARKAVRPYRIEEIKTPTTKSKDDKIRALIPFFSNNMVYFPQKGTEELERQMFRFPKADRVDRLDTLAMDLDIEKRPMKKTAPLRPQYDKRTGRVIKYK